MVRLKQVVHVHSAAREYRGEHRKLRFGFETETNHSETLSELDGPRTP
ncbi:MAG: hypothetical protein AABZ55_03630 [Bdellovibrionota bacterium]